MNWADKIALQLLSRDLMQRGSCLILGGADTGKTTLAAALGRRLAQNRPVGIIDADVGQSHIGPPATVGWAIVRDGQLDFSQLTAGGISFVGSVTPVGHLLQLTAAIVRCVEKVSEVTELMIVDTPGFISGPAAATLWWTVQRILKPKLIVAVQRSEELSDILVGLGTLGSQLELVESPPQISAKSPRQRRSYRQSRFCRYFRDSCLYNFSLSKVAVQVCVNTSRESLLCRLVGLRDEKGTDLAIGVIDDWEDDRDIAVVRAPRLNVQQVCCLVIGDVTIDIAGA